MKKTALLLSILLFTAAFLSCGEGNPPSGAGSEKEMIINPGDWQLTGTLTTPDGDGPFPLVVFVHGSGPANRDETIGQINVFKDIAADLAKLGLASIRYDKRTYLYGAEMATDVNLTVKEETVDDALSAVKFAQSADKIDPKRVYIAGHSMGGYLIPRIDQADSENLIAGYISLAGSVRSMNELIVEQIDYMLSLEKTMSEEDKAAQKKIYTDAVAQIAALTEADKGTDKALLGAYPAYWLDLANYKPDEEITSVKEPLLFLQGGHDYQVTTVDFDLWKAALAGNEKAAFKLYPDLTHAFTHTDKMSMPADYNFSAKVDEAVAADINEFIAGNN